MIQFTCKQCQKKLKAGPEQAGTKFKCTRCGTVGRVPRWTDELQGEEAERAGRAAAAAYQASANDDEAGAPLKFNEKRLRTDTEMDMTPMVDVTFQLLIFFMITASYALQKALEISKPESEAPVAQQRVEEESKDDYVIVRVDQDSVIWVNDREAPTRQELISRLRDEFGSHQGPGGLMISYHPDARHERIVTCMDVGAIFGARDITRRSSVEGPE